MATLTIRDVGDEVIDHLRAQAKANQRSLEDEVRFILERAGSLASSIKGFRERTEQSLLAEPSQCDRDSVALLREDRDR